MPRIRKHTIALAILILSFVVLFICCSREKEVERKQVILISVDTLRGDHITPYGYLRDTSPDWLTLLKIQSTTPTHTQTAAGLILAICLFSQVLFPQGTALTNRWETKGK